MSAAPARRAGPQVDRAYLAYLNYVEANYCARCNLGKGLLDCSRSLSDPIRACPCPISWSNLPAPPTRFGSVLPDSRTSATIMPGLASHLGP